MVEEWAKNRTEKRRLRLEDNSYHLAIDCEPYCCAHVKVNFFGSDLNAVAGFRLLGLDFTKRETAYKSFQHGPAPTSMWPFVQVSPLNIVFKFSIDKCRRT